MLGDYGAKKTTAAIHLARHYFGQGHAVFSNASCLFGWRLEREQMYTAIGFMPKNSVLLIDESSAALSSRVGHDRIPGFMLLRAIWELALVRQFPFTHLPL